MQDRFSYYDFIANFVPGALLLWSLTTFSGAMGKAIFQPTGNAGIDSILFAVLAFAVGHLTQYCAKYTVEPLIKVVFWGGRFFSELYLLAESQRCAEASRDTFKCVAREALSFPQDQLLLLDTADPDKRRARHRVSHEIYRRFDAFAEDNQIARKAVAQNALYGFFRGLAFVSFVCCGLFVYMLIRLRDPFWLGVCGLAAASGGAFVDRARQRGELYVRGLFDSVTAHFAARKSSRQ